MSTWKQLQQDDWRAHQWRTAALEHLLATIADAGPLAALAPIVRGNLEYRGSAFAGNALKELKFPVALADPRSSTNSAPWRLPAVYFWFAMREHDTADDGNVVRLQNLYKLKIETSFRNAVLDGFAQCQGGDNVYLRPEDGVVYQDAIFEQKSVGLAVAAWATWYLRGEWPDRSIAISGVIGSDGTVDAPGLIEKKLEALREHPIEYLVVPESGTVTDTEGLIQVPCRAGKRSFNAWLASCEQRLADHGVNLRPHPRLWRRWPADVLERLSHGQLIEVFDKDVERTDQPAFYRQHLIASDIERFDVSAVPPPSFIAATVGGNNELILLLDLKFTPVDTVWLCTDGQRGSHTNAREVNTFLQHVQKRPGGEIVLADPEDWTKAIMKRVSALPRDEQHRALVDVTGGLRHYSFGLVKRLREAGFPGTISYVWSHDYGTLNSPLPLRKTLVALDRPAASAV